jgi:hypothetical protein
MEAFAALMAEARDVRLALVTLDEDPLEPGAEARIALARAAAARTGAPLLIIDRPSEPRGHMGGYDPEFDRLFGEQLAGFLAGEPEAAIR